MNQPGGQNLPVEFLLTSFTEFIKIISEKRQDKDIIFGKVQNFINFAQRNNYDYKLCQDFLNYLALNNQTNFQQTIQQKQQMSLEEINQQQQSQKLRTYDGNNYQFGKIAEDHDNQQTNEPPNIINRECLRCKQIFLVDTSNFLVSISHFCQNCKLSYSTSKAL